MAASATLNFCPAPSSHAASFEDIRLRRNSVGVGVGGRGILKEKAVKTQFVVRNRIQIVADEKKKLYSGVDTKPTCRR